MSWDKNEHKMPPPIEEKEIKRGKKKPKSPTECVVKVNRRGHCGICGSANLVKEFVRYCKICGLERFIISTRWYGWLDRNEDRLCSCTTTYKNRKGKDITSLSEHSQIGVVSCADCGALKGPKCPNCKEPLWYKFTQDKDKFHCHKCGYIK